MWSVDHPLATNCTSSFSRARINSPLATIHSSAHLILPSWASSLVQNHSLHPSSCTIAGHTHPHSSSSSTKNSNQEPQKAQLSAMASLSVATISSLAAPAAKKRSGVTYVEGMNAYSGLKALNKVTMLGVRKTADYSFAKIVASLSPAGSKRRGGTFGAQCNAAGEIFKIAVIMNGLVLVGVAVGFVLLRLEAIVEESE